LETIPTGTVVAKAGAANKTALIAAALRRRLRAMVNTPKKIRHNFFSATNQFIVIKQWCQ
jgi:hypothetical protein